MLRNKLVMAAEKKLTQRKHARSYQKGEVMYPGRWVNGMQLQEERGNQAGREQADIEFNRGSGVS